MRARMNEGGQKNSKGGRVAGSRCTNNNDQVETRHVFLSLHQAEGRRDEREGVAETEIPERRCFRLASHSTPSSFPPSLLPYTSPCPPELSSEPERWLNNTVTATVAGAHSKTDSLGFDVRGCRNNIHQKLLLSLWFFLLSLPFICNIFICLRRCRTYCRSGLFVSSFQGIICTIAWHATILVRHPPIHYVVKWQ